MVSYVVLRETREPGYKFEIRMIKRPPKAIDSLIKQYLTGLSTAEQRKIFARILATASQGPKPKPEQYGDLGHGIYEIKIGQHRIPFFYAGQGLIVLTHGFFKTGQRAPGQQVLRARELRDLYVRRYGG